MQSLIAALVAAIASLSDVVGKALPLITQPAATDPTVTDAIGQATTQITSIATDLATAVAARQAADAGSGSGSDGTVQDGAGSTGAGQGATDTGTVGSIAPAGASADGAPLMAKHVE